MLLLLPLLWMSCTKQVLLSEAGLKDYINTPENGLMQEKQIGDYHIKVAYQPADLLLARELRAKPEVDSATFAALEEHYASYDYYIMSLSKGGKDVLYQAPADHVQFSELLQSLSFRMGDFVRLTSNEGDTIPVGDFIYQRTYGNSPTSSILFVFNKEEVKDSKQIRFHLEEFGLGIGKHVFAFQKKDMEAVPKLAFEKKRLNKHTESHTGISYNE